MKEQGVERAFQSHSFLTPKNQIPLILLPPIFQRISQLPGQYQQNNEHSVNCDLSPSGLTSNIHPFIFPQSLRAFEFPGFLLNFVSNLFLSACLGNIFKFAVFRILENVFCESKN